MKLGTKWARGVTTTHPILDADIDTCNFFSDHQPAFITCCAPVVSSLTLQSEPAPIFRPLTKDKIHLFKHFLTPPNKLIKTIQPAIAHLTQDGGFSLTSFITSEISMAYHHITRIPIHRTTKEEKIFNKLVRSIPSPDHPNSTKSMRELERLVAKGSADIYETQRNKLHQALVAGSPIRGKLAKT